MMGELWEFHSEEGWPSKKSSNCMFVRNKKVMVTLSRDSMPRNASDKDADLYAKSIFVCFATYPVVMHVVAQLESIIPQNEKALPNYIHAMMHMESINQFRDHMLKATDKRPLTSIDDWIKDNT